MRSKLALPCFCLYNVLPPDPFISDLSEGYENDEWFNYLNRYQWTIISFALPLANYWKLEAYMSCLPIQAKEGRSVLTFYIPLVILLPLIIFSTYFWKWKESN